MNNDNESTISIYLGRVDKDNYRYRCYATGIGNLYGLKTWKKTLHVYQAWGFYHWLINRYRDNHQYIEHRDHLGYVHKDVIVVSITISDEEFYIVDGELSKYYYDNKLDELFEEYLKENGKED